MSSKLYKDNKDWLVQIVGFKSGWLIVSFVAILWFGSFMAIKGLSDFPLNDDWVHAISVKHLIDTGEFTLIDYCGSTIITQVLWGVIFCSAGFSFSALRLSVVVLGFIGLWTIKEIGEKLHLSVKYTGVIVLTLFSNPLYYTLSGTFMTDIPFLVVSLLVVFFFIKAVKNESVWNFIFVCIFSILATLIRQIGLLLPLVLLAAFCVRKPFNLKLLIYSIASVVVVFLLLEVYLFYLKTNDILPSYFSGSEVIINNLLSGQIIKNLIKVFVYFSLYVGLFSLPVCLMYIRKELFRKHRIFVLMSVICSSVLIFLIYSGIITFPLGNVVNDIYIGPLTFLDTFWQGENLPAKMHWLGVGFVLFLTQFGFIMYVLLLWDKIKSVRLNEVLIVERIQIGLCVFGVIYIAFLALANTLFERYFLPSIVVGFFVIIPKNRLELQGNFRLLISLSLILLSGSFSLLGHKTYLEVNEARWKAANSLIDKGVSAENIDGGYEFNGWCNYNDQLSEEVKWWVKDVEYAITCGELSGADVINEIPYYDWINQEEKTIKILHLKE
ncbi:hypothetical protein [Carboxylicivirga sp. RSCT41]|uniref:hypothetical protein n=1 Tax=Carboxylicivirga agarovorans TaxID=3417570 RepID=UPI003D3342CF